MRSTRKWHGAWSMAHGVLIIAQKKFVVSKKIIENLIVQW